MKDVAQADRLKQRVDVRRSLDRLRRDVDQTGFMDAADQFEKQAVILRAGQPIAELDAAG